MRWIDYRERLKIGFNDEQKFIMLRNIMYNFIDNTVAQLYTEDAYYNFCMMTGKKYRDYNCSYQHLSDDIEHTYCMLDLLSQMIAFYNTYDYNHTYYSTQIVKKEDILSFFKKSLNDLNIHYDIFEDDDGLFIIPKGAEELDDVLVSEVLEWLVEYPNARKTYVIALKQYSDGIYVRDVADNMRKALESFLQEFLDNTKNLENNKDEICKYLGGENVDPGICGLFQPLINSYKKINDRIAKHNDRVDEKLLEFLIYQTGILIRMVITVSKLKGK